MNILKTCSRALFQKLLFTALIGVGCIIVDLAYYIFSKDDISLVLSSLVFVFSMFRIIGLYDIISNKKYDTLEGICVGIKPKPFSKYCTVKIIDDNGIETSLRLGKQTKLKIGFRYCFYFKQGERLSVGSEYLDAALSSDHFLGFEELGEFTNQNKDSDESDSNDETGNKS
ncbi:MAG: hypothetical protein FWD71_20960 [Oscillospiraceae bacterium]|nr:hypothetical protein [Oscillospiraceae bacterium]